VWELKVLVIASRSKLMDLPVIGPFRAARILADVGDVSRFADRNRFVSWTWTAPLLAAAQFESKPARSVWMTTVWMVTILIQVHRWIRVLRYPYPTGWATRGPT